MNATQVEDTMAATPAENSQLRENILNALAAFANQRPGLEYGNYATPGNWWAGVRAYRSESRSITRDLHDFRTLLSAVRWRNSIDAERLQAAFRAFSGRLTCRVEGSRVVLDYCTGQYFPTEFRKAACAVLASALWDWTRDLCMPKPLARAPYAHDASREWYTWNGGSKHPAFLSAGDWLRRHFRREFGARMQKRWFY